MMFLSYGYRPLSRHRSIESEPPGASGQPGYKLLLWR
jgi:hypothetical protein